ncbi:MAG: 1,4-dihydroxy-2-naphthoate octaprenyltransferase [Oceanospirillaceae bacterium]|jgi:1,4-dihydroxy-2-naphthoate octaprenyltransferase
MLSSWFTAIRPKTMSASIAPILLSQTLAYQHTAQFSWFLALVILLCTILLQISANLANDYFDDKAGIDTDQRLGPKRAIQAGLLSSMQVQKGMYLALFTASVLGVYLMYIGGAVYILLGLLSIAGVIGYSTGPKPLASNALGEIAVFVFFGPVAVIAAGYLQVQNVLTLHLYVSYAIQMGLLAAAIMLVNNIRDIKSDSHAHKTTLAILLGELKSKIIYTVFLCSVVALAYFNNQHSGIVLIGAFFALLLTILIFKRSAQQLNQQLAQTATFMLLWSMLCAFEIAVV